MLLDFINQDATTQKDIIEESINLQREPPASTTTASGVAGVDYEVADWASITLTSGIVYRFRAHAANTGACHVDHGGSPVSIKTIGGSDPVAGLIQANGVYDFYYDGTNLVVVNGLINVLVNPTLSSPTINNPSIDPAGTGLHAKFGDATLSDHYVRFRNDSGNSVDIGMSDAISASGGCLIWCGLLKSFGVAVNAAGTDFESTVNANLALEVTTAGVLKSNGNEVEMIVAQQSFSVGGDFSATGYARKTKGSGGNWVEVWLPIMTHSVSSQPISSSGDLPSTYRPAETNGDCYAAGAVVREVAVQSSGTIVYSYRDWSGSLTTQSTTSRPSTLRYFIPD